MEIPSVVEVLLHLFRGFLDLAGVKIFRLLGEMLVEPMLETVSTIVFCDVIKPCGELGGESDFVGLLRRIRGDFRFGKLHFVLSFDLNFILVQEILSLRHKTGYPART